MKCISPTFKSFQAAWNISDFGSMISVKPSAHKYFNFHPFNDLGRAQQIVKH